MNKLREQFESWAKDHLGQGYPLTVEDHTYVSPVTRWAFKAYKAAHEAAEAETEATVDRLTSALEGLMTAYKDAGGFGLADEYVEAVLAVNAARGCDDVLET